MLDIRKDFSNIGMGVSVAGGWVKIAGKDCWVSFLATADENGHRATNRKNGKRRLWHISASYHDGKENHRVTISRRDCFRVEAAEQAASELVSLLSQKAA